MREKANLLLAVSHVAAQRQQESKRQQEEQQELEYKRQAQVLQAQNEGKEKGKEEAEVKELKAKTFKEELEAWRYMRDKKARLNYFSRAEVDDEVIRIVEEVDHEFGLGKCRMEDGTEEPHEEWRARMLALRERIYRLWNDNEDRIRSALPRYVEGSAVRDAIVPPKFVGEKRQKISGLGACFQCHMQGMECSRGVITGRESGKSLKSQGCDRCERKGYRCIVEYEIDSDEEEGGKGEKITGKQKNYIWDWVDESSDTEPVAETLEMWERRRRGDKLEVIGSSMQWVEAGGFALPSREKAH
ncbi:hypothetical protein GGI43DRAFT_366053 [Trichoderma evansii]